VSLTQDQRAALRARIVSERERAVVRAAALARDFDEIVTASADAVRDDEHDPEGATIAFERTQVATLLADAHRQRAALDAAEERLGRDAAGRCAVCGNLIAFERLLARPTATSCVACAEDPGRVP
jgi:DnaK suppressor protein